jgi:hypothetical protein
MQQCCCDYNYATRRKTAQRHAQRNTRCHQQSLLIEVICLVLQVSSASGRGVKELFASLFAAVLAQLPGADCELVATAGRDALAARQAEGIPAAGAPV